MLLKCTLCGVSFYFPRPSVFAAADASQGLPGACLLPQAQMDRIPLLFLLPHVCWAGDKEPFRSAINTTYKLVPE